MFQSILRPIHSPVLRSVWDVSVGGGSAPWTPAALFAASEQGCWYDPSDMSTLFQDSAGTTPVTAAGQPVGRMLDKSGNGNHVTQATAASRPLLAESGGLRWLAFDGVNDFLQSATGGGFGAQEVAIGYMPTGGAGVSRDVLSDRPNDFRIAASGGNAHACVFANVAIAGTATVGTAIVGGGRVTALSGTVTASRNGVDGTTAAASATAPAVGYGIARAEGGAAGHFPGNIYGLVWTNRVWTTQERSDTNSYLASKSGVTL